MKRRRSSWGDDQAPAEPASAAPASAEPVRRRSGALPSLTTYHRRRSEKCSAGQVVVHVTPTEGCSAGQGFHVRVSAGGKTLFEPGDICQPTAGRFSERRRRREAADQAIALYERGRCGE